jgi:hypothetical protein
MERQRFGSGRLGGSAGRFRGPDHGDLRGSVICCGHARALDAMAASVLLAWRVSLHHAVTEVRERGGAEWSAPAGLMLVFS